MDPLPENIPPATLDMKTGKVVYKGETYFYDDWLEELDRERREWSDYLQTQRDVTSDIQCLWGTKRNRFRDDWFGYQLPLRKPRGYPEEAALEYEGYFDPQVVEEDP